MVVRIEESLWNDDEAVLWMFVLFENTLWHNNNEEGKILLNLYIQINDQNQYSKCPITNIAMPIICMSTI